MPTKQRKKELRKLIQDQLEVAQEAIRRQPQSVGFSSIQMMLTAARLAAEDLLKTPGFSAKDRKLVAKIAREEGDGIRDRLLHKWSTELQASNEYWEPMSCELRN